MISANFSHCKIYAKQGLLAGPIREANLPGVAQYNVAGIQVSFSDVGEVSGRVSVLARPTAKVDGIGDHRVQTRRHLGRGGGCRVNRERVSRLGDPVMLDMENQRV